jgi:hypothetical protein
MSSETEAKTPQELDELELREVEAELKEVRELVEVYREPMTELYVRNMVARERHVAVLERILARAKRS